MWVRNKHIITADLSVLVSLGNCPTVGSIISPYDVFNHPGNSLDISRVIS